MAISDSLPGKNSVNKFIQKGGAVTSEKKESKTEGKKVKQILLKLPSELVDEIDSQCRENKYKIKKSRHSWVTEAIVDKLNKKEENEI